MKIEFEIPNEKVTHLNEKGKSALTLHCKKVAEDIVDEATRLEISRNESVEKEITAALIVEAVHITKFTPVKRKNFWIYVIKIFQFVSLLFTGALFDLSKLQDTFNFWVFIISLTIAIGTSVYLIFINE